MSLRDEIITLAAEFQGDVPNESKAGDLLLGYGLEGDDANDFLEIFAEKYDVDMSSFRWYFHYNADEPPGFRRVVPVDISGRRLPDVPVSVDLLVQAAEEGAWAYSYPEHKVGESLISRFRLTLSLLAIMLAITVYVVLM